MSDDKQRCIMFLKFRTRGYQRNYDTHNSYMWWILWLMKSKYLHIVVFCCHWNNFWAEIISCWIICSNRLQRTNKKIVSPSSQSASKNYEAKGIPRIANLAKKNWNGRTVFLFWPRKVSLSLGGKVRAFIQGQAQSNNIDYSTTFTRCWLV